MHELLMKFLIGHFIGGLGEYVKLELLEQPHSALEVILERLEEKATLLRRGQKNSYFRVTNATRTLLGQDNSASNTPLAKGPNTSGYSNSILIKKFVP